MPTLSLSEREETTVRSTLSERDDQECEEQRQQSSITSKAILRIFLNNDSTPTQSQVNNTSPNQLENDEPEETPTAHLTTTTPPSSSLRPEVDESRDDDGYSNTAYLENISAALGRNGPLQQSTLSPTTDSSRCSSPSSVSDAVLQTDDRRGRKKKDRRRKAFEKLVRHLENGAEEDDEENFGDGRPRSCSSVRLKSVIRREYLPEHVRSHGAGNGCPGTSGSYVLPSSYHYHYHRPSSSYGSRYCCCCCCYCCAWKNCGNCALLKVFVGVTMLVAILLCLAERCSAPVDGKICSTTPQLGNFSTTAAEAFYSNATSTSSPIIVIGGNWTGNWSILANESTIKNESAAPASNIVHCVFRDFYIVLLSLGLLVFFSIFLAYTCKLVVHYHHFPWFLTESIAVGLFSVLLFVASIIGLLLKRQTASSTLGLIDALLGFIIAFSAYLSHFNGLMPIMNISVDDDPDCNQLNRILGEKQFSRIVRGF